MPLCPKCREVLGEGAKFCQFCGVRISPTEELTNPEIRILYLLLSQKGESSFTRMMGESGMCFGMFGNYAESLIKKGLIKKGETFKDYVVTPKGIREMKKVAEKGNMPYWFFEGYEIEE